MCKVAILGLNLIWTRSLKENICNSMPLIFSPFRFFLQDFLKNTAWIQTIGFIFNLAILLPFSTIHISDEKYFSSKLCFNWLGDANLQGILECIIQFHDGCLVTTSVTVVRGGPNCH